jgi:hypothetical protein
MESVPSDLVQLNTKSRRNISKSTRAVNCSSGLPIADRAAKVINIIELSSDMSG